MTHRSGPCFPFEFPALPRTEYRGSQADFSLLVLPEAGHTESFAFAFNI
jgi:hypothetical protein